jgi:hypothetical protein
MIVTVPANDGINEPKFVYYVRMEGDAKLSSNMKEFQENAVPSE